MKTLFNIKIFSLSIYCLFFCMHAAAAVSVPVTVTAQTDRSTITIGDRFELKIRVDTAKDVEMGDFNPIGELSKSFEVKDFKVKEKALRKRNIYDFSYMLSTFTTGTYEIPELVLSYVMKDSDETREIKTPPIKIEVESVKPRPDDADDIRGLKETASLGVSPWWFVLAGIAAAGAVLWAVRKYLLKKKKLGGLGNIEDTRPWDEIALENLRKLKESPLLGEGRVKDYYIDLSEIVRQYIEKRFFINVLDRTTMELYKLMRDMELDRKITVQIKNLLDDCDLVKFAKYIPQNSEIESDFANAVDLVQKTKPVINLEAGEGARETREER